MRLDPASIRLHRRGHGPALVMLHCLGMDHHLWDGLGGLADTFELIAYDFPGHGETPVPATGYEIEDLSEQLAAVLQQAGIARAHVMGISLGGLVAQHFAATNPAVVERLVLCDTTPCYGEEAKANWPVRAAAARQNGTASLLPAVEKTWFTDGFRARSPVPPEIRLVRDTFARCPGEGYALACEALGAADLVDLAGEIHAPTLVLCGSDETLAFREAAEWLAANIAGAKLAYIPDAAHASVLEQTAWVERALRTFLKSHA
ncbi:MAG TPA: alpha/beta fold hydrolase [Rhodopila sp.]|nr:alpha/beta fold hydrolase [Rhodopila sp.]